MTPANLIARLGLVGVSLHMALLLGDANGGMELALTFHYNAY